MRFATKTRGKIPFLLKCLLKKIYFYWQIRNGKFISQEEDFILLEDWINKGDWVLDIGANVGHYTHKLSHLVGPEGRVFSFEPVSETFNYLANNIFMAKLENVTPFCCGISESTATVTMYVPQWSGRKELNFYRSSIQSSHESTGFEKRKAFVIDLKSLSFPKRIAFIKCDVEGHEFEAMKGAETLIQKDKPDLLIEDPSFELISLLFSWGYQEVNKKKTHNKLFRYCGN